MKCTAIPLGHVCNVFVEAKPFFDKAVARSRGRMGTDDLLRMVLTGESQLWIAYDDTNSNKMHAIVVTTLKRYPHKCMVDMTFCAGDRMTEWYDDMMKLIDAWAMSNKFDGMEFVGRKGWGKTLAKYGLKETYRTFEKDYDYG